MHETSRHGQDMVVQLRRRKFAAGNLYKGFDLSTLASLIEGDRCLGEVVKHQDTDTTNIACSYLNVDPGAQMCQWKWHKGKKKAYSLKYTPGCLPATTTQHRLDDATDAADEGVEGCMTKPSLGVGEGGRALIGGVNTRD